MAESALDVMNAALGDVVSDAAGEGNAAELETEALADGATADGGDSVASGDAENAAGADGADGEGDGQGEGAADGDGAEGEPSEAEAAAAGLTRDPATGKFIKKEAVADAAKPGEQKPGDKAGAKKEPDIINDPIPKDLKPATQERMRGLVKVAKEVTAERDQVRNDFNYMVEGIKATGTTPEQYGEVLSFMALFNSQDPAQQEKALELIEGVAERLATLLGKERTASDPLANHPELREAVAKGQITPQYARQLATMKNRDTVRTEIVTAHSQADQAQRAAAQELTTARSDLNTLEKTLAATDPLYAQKKALIVPVLKPIFKVLPPSQWKAKFEEAYKNAKLPNAPRPRPNPTPNNQPLRGGRGSGNGAGSSGSGMSTTANSGLDAMNAALASMGK